MNIEKYRFVTDRISEEIFDYIFNNDYNERVTCS